MSMCPEPALLVAYLDGTLFHRDAGAVEDHVAGCESCAELLDAMRARREEEERAHRSRQRMRGGIAVAVVGVAALALWAMWPASNRTPSREVASVDRDAAPATAPTNSATTATRPTAEPASPPPVASAPPPPQTVPARETPVSPPQQTREPAPAAATTRTKTPPVKAGAKTTAPRPAAVNTPTAEPAAKPAPTDAGGLVLRGRNRNRSVMWRARERTIEHSTDGGATWTTEHTADNAIRAGAFVDGNVAWVAGENGLVLRRTKNGWFNTSSPAAGTITGIRASSPSKATVTFADGRVYQTDNGGVTWSQP